MATPQTSEIISKIREKLEGQAWFQELMTKWDEMDPRVRKNLSLGIVGGGVLILFVSCFTFYWSVRSSEKELYQKQAIIQMLQTSAEEMRMLRASRIGGANVESGGWSGYFTDVAQMSRVQPESLLVSDPKKLDSKNSVQENIFEITLKKITLSQLRDYAYSIEHGTRPVKIRNLEVDTELNPEGYLSAKISVSAYDLEVGKS